MGWFDSVKNAVSQALSGPVRAVNTPNNPYAEEIAANAAKMKEQVFGKLSVSDGGYTSTPVTPEMQVPQESSPGFMDKIGDYLGGSNGLIKKVSNGVTSDGGLAALGMGASIYGGIQGNKAAQEGFSQAMDSQRQAADQAGAYEALGPSQAATVADNQAMIGLRSQALQGLQQRAQMGLTPEDQAQLNQLRNQTNNQFQARQATIQQDMGRRGMQNSGLALAAQMGNNQALTQQQANSADNQAATSFKARQDALSNLSNQSSNALSQDFNRDMERAKNQDAVSKFNTTNQMDASKARAAYTEKLGTMQGNVGVSKGNLATSIGNTVAGGLGSLIDKNKNKVV